MAYPFTNVHNSATISTSEYFLFSNSTTATYQTTAAKISGYISFAAMTAAETYDVKAYEKINGGSPILLWSARLVGVQAEAFSVPEFWGSEGYEVSVTKVAGTDRAISWSLNRDVGESNIVAWNGTAPNNLISGNAPADVQKWNSQTLQSGKFDLGIIHEGTAQAGTSGTITLAAGASANNNFYTGAVIYIVGGTGSGQGPQLCSSYTGATKVLTVFPGFVATPDNTSKYMICNVGYAAVELWRNSQPATASGSNIRVDVFAMQNNVVSANAIASNAITSAKIASGAITSTQFAAGAINNAAIAANAIAASNVNTDLDARLADAVWDEARAGHTTAGSYGKTSEWAGTSSLTAADITDAVWDEVLSDHLTAGSTGAALNTAASASGATPSAIADAVWDELASDHDTAGTMGANLQTLASLVTTFPTAPGGTVTASTLVDRAMAISDMHDNFVNTTEWLTWLNQEQKSLQLFLARAGWALPFYSTEATITSTGWDLETEGGAAESVATSAAGRYIFTPTAVDVMALVCVHELRNGEMKLLRMENDVDFLRQATGSTNTQGHATCYRVRRFGVQVHLEFFPTPQAGETYFITFLNAPIPLAALTDSLALPMGWEERLVLGMARRALIKEESSPDKIEQLMAEMDKEIEELCWNTVTSESPRVRNTDPSLQSWRNGYPPWQSWYWF